MTIRVTVTVLCDAARAHGCHREYSAQGDSVPAAVAAVQREAQSAGRRKGRTGLLETDVCPACTSPPTS